MIVFNRSSGETHLLDAFSAALLREIEAGPLTGVELAGQLSSAFDLPPQQIADRVAEVCSILAGTNLIDAVP